MTSELMTFNHLRCHSSSTALGTRTGYCKLTWRGTYETPLWLVQLTESLGSMNKIPYQVKPYVATRIGHTVPAGILGI